MHWSDSEKRWCCATIALAVILLIIVTPPIVRFVRGDITIVTAKPISEGSRHPGSPRRVMLYCTRCNEKIRTVTTWPMFGADHIEWEKGRFIIEACWINEVGYTGPSMADQCPKCGSEHLEIW